jgi:glycosyltransferase involved in cell wall biosynthesis
MFVLEDVANVYDCPRAELKMVISVVTPSYNQGSFIERTIRSVLDQSGDFSIEYFIADGGSTDDTIQIIKDYESQVREGVYPIRCQGVKFGWVSEKDRGQADAVNKGILNTSGNIIAWINSDDIYHPNAFSTVTTFFHNNPSALAVYGLSYHIDENDHVIGPYPTEPWDYDRLFETCYLCQPGVFFRRELVNELGPLDPNLQLCMDYELWLRYGGFTDFHYLQETLAGSRLYDSTKTLGQVVAVHNEINDMFKTKFGHVPRRWIYTFARIVAQDLEKTNSSTKGNLDIIRVIAQDAFLKWWGYIPSDELAYMDMFFSHPKTSSWSVKRRLQGLNQLRIGLDLGNVVVEKPELKKLGANLAIALAQNYPNHQFLAYNFSNPIADSKELAKEFTGVRLKNVHLVSSLRDYCEISDPYLEKANNLMATLGYPDIIHTDCFDFTDIPDVKIVFSIVDMTFTDHPEHYSTSELEHVRRGIEKASLFADMILVHIDSDRRKFLEMCPKFPEDRVRIISSPIHFSDDNRSTLAHEIDRDEERPKVMGNQYPWRGFAGKLVEVYQEVSRLPKRVDNSETGSIGLKFRSSDFIYRTPKKNGLINRTLAWFIRLAEKNASIKNRFKKVGFLKKLVKLARPKFARKFPDWV